MDIKNVNDIKSLMQKISVQEYAMHIKNTFDINIHPTLSCRGISNLMGFSSSSIGYKIEKWLEDNNLITIKRLRDENALNLCSIINFSNLFSC